MKIGIFDSGVGGLIVAAPLMKAFPDYDYVYLGDAKNVPYGDRSEEEIYNLTVTALRFLFDQDCLLVVVACNTVSAEALHKIQTIFIPEEFPDKKVLGVIVPMAEEAVKATRNGCIGALATTSTVASGAYRREISKLLPNALVTQAAATDLVPLIEHHSGETQILIKKYLTPLTNQDIDTLILGCTHYPKLRNEIAAELPASVTILSPDEVLAAKLGDYLERHSEIERELTRGATRTFMVTRTTAGIEDLADRLYGKDIDLLVVDLILR